MESLDLSELERVRGGDGHARPSPPVGCALRLPIPTRLPLLKDKLEAAVCAGVVEPSERVYDV